MMLPRDRTPTWQPDPTRTLQAPLHFILEVPYLSRPQQPGIMELSIELATRRVFVGAKAVKTFRHEALSYV